MEKVKNVFGSPATHPVGTSTPDVIEISDPENSAMDEKPQRDAQEGIQKVEAVTLLWTKTQLLIAYAAVLLVFFVVSMEEQIQNNLVYYVYAKFKLSPLITTSQIVSQICVGVFKLPLAKYIDLIGRAEGFLFMTLVSTIGVIMMAACNNATTYAAAYVFYWVGFDGMSYVLQVFVADTSSLKNRAFVTALTTSPYIATTFIGPPAAQSFIDTSGWRWGYGVFCIITPVISLPVAYMIWSNQRKALHAGLISKRAKSGRTVLQSIEYYFWEFDFMGLLLIIAGVSLILLPFSLAAYQSKGWGSGMIIAMLVIGGLCLIAFPIYEKFFSRKCFLPFELMADRTILGACVLSGLIQISFYQWDSYFYYFIEVVYGYDVTDTGYMYNIYSIGSCFWLIICGVAIRRTGYFKWLAAFSLALEMLGVGLMIHFRSNHAAIGYIIMCQIFIAFGGGALVLCNEMAVMSAVSHRHIAGILAFLSLFSSIGAAIGSAVSGVIYEHTFPQALANALPGNSTLVADLYASTATQLLYPFGTPERTAVLTAYAHSQKVLCISGLAFLIPGILCIAVWRNYNISQMTQIKGRVI